MVDRRYGVNKYGDGKLYGSSDQRNALAWDASFDWDEDGMYESNEADRLTSVKISRGRTKLIKPNGQGFEPVRVGTATLELSNHDGRFDAWNSASPLYPNVSYGKKVRIRVRDLSQAGEVVYPMFAGRIVNLTPAGYGADAKVIVQVNDAIEYLRNTNARVALQTNITVDQAIDYILSAASYGSQGERNLDVSSGDVIKYWWSDAEALAMNELERLAASFLGYFFIDRDGDARYVQRTSYTNPTISLTQSDVLKDIGNPQPYEIRRNTTRIITHPRTTSSVVTLWQLLGNTPTIQPGANNKITIFTAYTYNNDPVPATSVITPVAGAANDYAMNTQSNGLGTDKTANCTLVFTDFGNSAKVEITNNDAGTVYLTKLQIRGTAVYEANAAEVTYPSTAVSAPRALVFDLPWQQDVNVAVDLAGVLGPFFSELKPTPNVTLEYRPDIQFIPELFDIAVVDLAKIGLTGQSMRVGGIEHTTLSENCQVVRTRLYFEPYVTASNYMQWDTNSVWDTSTVFGW